MAAYDNRAFDAMESATKSKASNLFTESEYNAFATDKDRAGYDQKAFGILRDMYEADSTKNKFKDIDFKKYLSLLKPELFEERVLSPKGDLKAGDLFSDIYERDFDQFRASALKGMPAEAGVQEERGIGSAEPEAGVGEPPPWGRNYPRHKRHPELFGSKKYQSPLKK